LWALSVVRAVAGGVRAPVMVGRCQPNSSGGGAQAENGPAGCRTHSAAADGKSVSADLGAEPGGAGCAAVADASPQAGAGADASEESTAGHGAKPGRAEEAQALDARRTGGAEEVGVVALRGGATRAVAANAGWFGARDHATEPASGRRSPTASRGDAVDDASGSRSGNGVGDGADAGTGGTVCVGQAGGQLLRADSQRALQRGRPAAGAHQQAGQFVSTLFVGGSRTECSAL